MTYYKLSMLSTTMYYMRTTATNKQTEEDEEITMKCTVDESNSYNSNAIIQGENGNDFQYEMEEKAEEIEKKDVPDEVLEKFEDRIDKFENVYITVRISRDTSEET